MVVVIFIVVFLVMRWKRMDKDKSMFVYDNDDYDIREDVMDYDEDGVGWCLYMFLIKIICVLCKFLIYMF